MSPCLGAIRDLASTVRGRTKARTLPPVTLEDISITSLIRLGVERSDRVSTDQMLILQTVLIGAAVAAQQPYSCARRVAIQVNQVRKRQDFSISRRLWLESFILGI